MGLYLTSSLAPRFNSLPLKKSEGHCSVGKLGVILERLFFFCRGSESLERAFAQSSSTGTLSSADRVLIARE